MSQNILRQFTQLSSGSNWKPCLVLGLTNSTPHTTYVSISIKFIKKTLCQKNFQFCNNRFRYPKMDTHSTIHLLLGIHLIISRSYSDHLLLVCLVVHQRKQLQVALTLKTLLGWLLSRLLHNTSLSLTPWSRICTCRIIPWLKFWICSEKPLLNTCRTPMMVLNNCSHFMNEPVKKTKRQNSNWARMKNCLKDWFER